MFTTRTAFGIVSALLLTVAGASACSSSAESDTASATRSVTHELGTVEVPASPQRILALDEYAGLSALALGVKPPSSTAPCDRTSPSRFCASRASKFSTSDFLRQPRRRGDRVRRTRRDLDEQCRSTTEPVRADQFRGANLGPPVLGAVA